MPIPVIRVDGLAPPPLGSKSNGTKADGATVALTLASVLGIDSLEWRVSKPNGSAAALGASFPASPFSTTLGPLAAGETYILTAYANGSATQYAQAAISVPLANGLRVPRSGESSQWDPTDGIEADWRAMALLAGAPPGFASFTAPPLAATFTANAGNGAGASLVDISGGGLLLSGAKGASDDSKNAGFYRAKSGAKTLTVCVRHVLTDTGAAAGANAAIGLYFEEAATGRMAVFRSFIGALPEQLFFNSYTAPTTAVGGGSVLGIDIGRTYWLRLVDDGVNIVASYSTNGKTWIQASTAARGAFLTTTPGGDRMGVFASGFSSAVQAEILSYAET